jgi:hypothetical protein
VKKTPVEGPVKKSPEGLVTKTPVGGRIKKAETRPPTRGRCPMTSTP